MKFRTTGTTDQYVQYIYLLLKLSPVSVLERDGDFLLLRKMKVFLLFLSLQPFWETFRRISPLGAGRKKR